MNKNIYEKPILTVVEYVKEDILSASKYDLFDNTRDDPFAKREDVE